MKVESPSMALSRIFDCIRTLILSLVYAKIIHVNEHAVFFLKVGRLSAKPERDVLMQDFAEVETVMFPR